MSRWEPATGATHTMYTTQTRITSNRRPAGRDWSSSPSGIILAVALAAVALTVLIAIVARQGNLHQRSAPLLIELMDMNQPKLARAHECGMFRQAFDLMPVGTEVLIYAFDGNSVLRFRGKPTDSNDFAATEDLIINGKPDAPYTAPAVALEKIMPDVTRAAGEKRASFIIENTDGDDVRPADTKRKAQALAKVPGVTLWVTNVTEQQNARNISEATYRALGNHLILSGRTDIKQGWTRFQSVLEH
jgi:hypothetical protein